MAVADKQLLIQELEKSLEDKLTAKDIQAVIDALVDKIVNYDIQLKTGVDRCVDFEEYLKYYLDAKRVEGRSEKTLARYKYILGRLMEDIHVPLKDVSIYHLRSYIMKEK